MAVLKVNAGKVVLLWAGISGGLQNQGVIQAEAIQVMKAKKGARAKGLGRDARKLDERKLKVVLSKLESGGETWPNLKLDDRKLILEAAGEARPNPIKFASKRLQKKLKDYVKKSGKNNKRRRVPKSGKNNKRRRVQKY